MDVIAPDVVARFQKIAPINGINIPADQKVIGQGQRADYIADHQRDTQHGDTGSAS